MERQIFLCRDSQDGIFSGVYDAWMARVPHDTVELYPGEPDNRELFCNYHWLECNAQKAAKVLGTMQKRLGEEGARWFLYAASSKEKDRGTAVFRTISACLKSKAALENQKDVWIRKAAQYQKNVWNEYHHYLGFVRFRESWGGILLGKIAPENQVLPLLAGHFQNRLPNERWIILDERRNLALFHEKQSFCFLAEGVQKRLEKLDDEWEEGVYEKLWKQFTASIAIAERENRRLQNQLLPLRFQENMVEFDKNPTLQLGKTDKVMNRKRVLTNSDLNGII